MVWRGRHRNQAWGKQFEACVRNGSFELPSAAVVQFIPTEGCNLRCPFCNQWGENGYSWQARARSRRWMKAVCRNSSSSFHRKTH